MPRTAAALAPSVQAAPVRGLSRDGAARYVGVSASSFDTMIAEGVMPKPRTWHARNIWDVRELDLAFDALPQQDKPPAAKRTGWEDVEGWPS